MKQTVLTEKYESIVENNETPIKREYSNAIAWKLPDGRLHRVDGPAMIYKDGGKVWYRYGQKHRVNGPAIIHKNGNEYWFNNGHLHRLDGPAITLHRGRDKYWCINGKEYTKEEFDKEVERLKHLKDRSKESGLDLTFEAARIVNPNWKKALQQLKNVYKFGKITFKDVNLQPFNTHSLPGIQRNFIEKIVKTGFNFKEMFIVEGTGMNGIAYGFALIGKDPNGKDCLVLKHPLLPYTKTTVYFTDGTETQLAPYFSTTHTIDAVPHKTILDNIIHNYSNIPASTSKNTDGSYNIAINNQTVRISDSIVVKKIEIPITHLPFNINRLNGNLDINNKNLKTFKGLPKIVTGDVDIIDIPPICSLEGFPEQIGGNLIIYRNLISKSWLEQLYIGDRVKGLIRLRTDWWRQKDVILDKTKFTKAYLTVLQKGSEESGLDLTFEKCLKESLNDPVLIKSFEELPDFPPYGFLVWPDGTIGIAYNSYQHIDLLQMKDNNVNWDTFFGRGGIRMVSFASDVYVLEGLFASKRVSNKAYTIARDITAMYHKDREYEEYVPH